jgi:hypothetical protein
MLEIAATGGAQLAGAGQSGIRKGDAVASLRPDETHLYQGVKGRPLALLGSTASPGQSDVAQQLSLFFVPARRHSATPIFAASTFCVIISPARAHQGYHPMRRRWAKQRATIMVNGVDPTERCSPRRGRRWRWII